MAEAATSLRIGTPRARWVLFATVLGSSMAFLDATVVNIALERIGAEFDASFAGLQWTINAYTLTLAALILLGGSLGDRFGRRKIFVVGVVWFAVASLLCGLAPSVEFLVVARGLQGVGGALLTPGSLAIISAAFTGKDRAAAIGAWSGLGGIAGALGPFLGGWLVEWNWRAVFLINLPVAALILWTTLRHVPESRNPEAAPRLDVPGTLFAVLGLGALTYALTAAGEDGASGVVLGFGAVGVVALLAFVVAERRSKHPLVPGELFGNAQFTAANLVTFLVYAALGAQFVLVVLQLQIVSGFSPLLSGAALLPVTALLLLLSSKAGALSARIGPRLPMAVGPIVSAAGMLLLLRVGEDPSYVLDVLPAMVVFGLGLALTVAPLTTTVLDAAADRHAGVASGVNNAVARAAGLLAVAVIPAIAGLAGSDYTDPEAFNDGFRTAMWLSAALLFAGGLISWAFISSTTRSMTAEPEPAPEAPDGQPESAPERVQLPRCPVTGAPLGTLRRDPATNPTCERSGPGKPN